MKRKSITLTICILAVLALASIGFASWIISNPEASGHDEGTVWVDDVTSEVYNVNATLSNKSIIFGTPDGYVAQPNDWLTNSNTDKTDSLETILTVVITPEDTTNVTATLNSASLAVTLSGEKTVDGSPVAIAPADLTTLFTDAGLGSPTLEVLKPGTVDQWLAFDGTIDKDDMVIDTTSGTCKIRITFSWGSNGNPYTYYNAKAFNDYRTQAETFLKGVYTALNGLSYKVTIK